MWAILAMIVATTSAGMFILHEKFKPDRLAMLIWARTVMLLISLSFSLIIGWPSAPLFYVLTIINAFISSFGDLRVFYVVEKYGAGVLTRLTPTSIIITFSVWIIINPDLLESYFAYPIQGSGIILSLLSFVWFASNLQKNPISMSAIKSLLPVIILSGLVPVFSKTALDDGDFHKGVFAYLTIQSIAMLTIWSITAFYRCQTTRISFTLKPAALTGITMGLLACTAMIAKGYAFILVINPAYVYTIIFSQSFLVLLYYRMIKYREKSNVLSEIGMALSILLLIIFTNLKMD